MSTYFVKERVNHDGRQYERGEEINLDENTASRLLNSGVVSESPVVNEVATEVAPAPEDVKASLDGGGTAPVETGEPSLDGNETKAGSEGTELTGGEKKEGSILGRIFGGKKDEEATTGDAVVPTGTETSAPVVTDTSSTAPVNDPSVGL